MGWDWPAAEHPPRSWGPPRGGSRYGVAGRDLGECGSDAEADAVRNLGAITRRLETAADDRRVVTDRGLAALTGLPLSTVQGFRTGSRWPSFATLARFADALGFRVTLGWVARDWKAPLFAPARFEDLPGLERDCATPRARARLWHDAAVAQLRWARRAQRLHLWEVAADAGTHPDVVAKAEQTIVADTWVGVPLLSAMAFAHRCWLTIEPAGRDYAPPLWTSAA